MHSKDSKKEKHKTFRFSSYTNKILILIELNQIINFCIETTGSRQNIFRKKTNILFIFLYLHKILYNYKKKKVPTRRKNTSYDIQREQAYVSKKFIRFVGYSSLRVSCSYLTEI
uniref:(northern house mosquito) hypothetical protein n=1 Tax=Culex pipiens TaxID=7175 RepID=A0A8D8CRC7_CULPI